MSKERKIVMVFAETDFNGELLPITLELLQAGKNVARVTDAEIHALTIGDSNTKGVNQLKRCGLDEVWSVENPALKHYHQELYVSVFKQACENAYPEVILFGHTLTAIDLAPRMAFELNTGVVTDCVQIESKGNELYFHKPTYSGNITAGYKFETSPCIATMRLHACEPLTLQESESGNVNVLDVDIDLATGAIEAIERNIEETKGVKLSTADIVVAGGRGMGGKEGFEMLTDLADTMGAALGASRPPCDLCWVDKRAQVGLTGEIVSPAFYLAVGISGSFQHLAGMVDSKTIVAINENSKANIFKVADYGVVGRFEEVLPAFRAALQSEDHKK
jgi:electron transfer flavoprotein alpha subunit